MLLGASNSFLMFLQTHTDAEAVLDPPPASPISAQIWKQQDLYKHLLAQHGSKVKSAKASDKAVSPEL